MSLFTRLLEQLNAKRQASAARPQTSFAAPRQMDMSSVSSIFDLIGPQAQAQFNVTPATGSKPKNYTPVKVGMNNIPLPSVFALMGGGQQMESPFTVTAATGTKPKNYKPVSIEMNAPQMAGPQAMQQMLAMMSQAGYGATPFSPYGQG